MKQIPYVYRNLPIPGGGYVTGFLYHPVQPGILYARTDIGGTYRFDVENRRWISLIPHVTMGDLSETFPIALALDSRHPERLYIACGENEASRKCGVLAVSEDYGEHFRYKPLPVFVHGNLNGRGTGERLWVDNDDENTLYLASQQDGLWISGDGGDSWRKADLTEQYLTFVTQVGRALIVGTAGVTTWDGSRRGHSLYASYDKGAHFEPMEEPESMEIDGCRLNGLVAQRWAADGRYLYITFASTGRCSYVLENGYSCDSGDAIDGRVARYEMEDDGSIGKMTALYPAGDGYCDFGFGGISASRRTPGLLVCSTIARDDGDCVYRSFDFGESWECILYDLEIGKMTFRAPYMRPECNGGHNLIHWLSCMAIDPFDDNEAWFNTGTGVFVTHNLQDRVCCEFTDWCDGLEETVHLNVYSMPRGDVQVIDILGDLGGFAFTNLDRPCANSFADAEGNRYITCINADYSDADPECLLVTPRGNWKGKTKGGLILSRDQGRTFRRLPMPWGLSAELDEALRLIECPNVNSGWCALSPDTRHIVWPVADGIELPVGRLLVSHDSGETFAFAGVYDAAGKRKTEGNLKVYADRSDSTLFYGFGSHSDFYVSRDGGDTFTEKPLPQDFPCIDFGLIDCANKTDVRGETGRTGVFYMALGSGGMWKLCYDSGSDTVSVKRLSRARDVVYRLGLGLGAPGADYYRDAKAIYCNGIIGGEYGFYRSPDDGATYERLNTPSQMFGEINSIDGDCRVFGRFYLATGSNGVKYGEMEHPVA